MSDPLDEMAQRFLSWPLPADVCADAVACKQGAPHRTGTNLLTATQARQPAAALEQQICSATEPKNEREWWAHHEIARLRDRLAVETLALVETIARASRAEAEAAGLRADAERWRTVSAMMTHEHRGDAVGWTLSVLLPGDDPDAAIDAARGES